MEQTPFIIKDFSGGWNTEVLSDFLPANESPNLQNADISSSGSVKKTNGYAELGSDSEDVDIYKLIVAPNRNGTSYLLKFCGTKIKIWDTDKSVWSTVKTGLTAGSETNSEIFNNILYIVNQDDTAFTFDLGKITTLDGDVAIGASTIDLTDASTFDSSGTIYAGNQAIAYTGKSSNQLTGVTGVNAAIDDGSIVVKAADNEAAIPKGNITTLYGGRLLVAGVLGSGGAVVYGSKATDRTNFTIAGGGATDDAFAVTFPSQVTSIKKFYNDSAEEVLMVFLSNNEIWTMQINDDATLGTLTPINQYRQSITAINHASTIAGDNNVYHIDLNNQVRSLAPIYAQSGVDRNYSDIVSRNHKNYFKNSVDFSKARAIVSDDLYIVSGIVGGVTLNNRLFIYDKSFGNWKYRTNAGASDLAFWNNKIMFSSNTDNKVYYFDDDLKSDDDEAIDFIYETPDITVDRLKFERLRRVRISGFISSNASTTMKMYKNFKTVEIGKFTISGSDSDITGALIGADTGVYARTIFAESAYAGSSVSNIRFFIADLEFKNLPDLENFRLVFRNNEANTYFEITAIKPFIIPMDEFYFPDNYIKTN